VDYKRLAAADLVGVDADISLHPKIPHEDGCLFARTRGRSDMQAQGRRGRLSPERQRFATR
jgi:hypothetical protein